VFLKHGFHNVSRWMTWLPISLKNAAKCDKWYQLQNHSITESLNANGAREKPSTAIPVHAVSLSVEQKPNSTKESWLVRTMCNNVCSCGRVVTPSQPSKRRFMGNLPSCFCLNQPFGGDFDKSTSVTTCLNQTTSFVTDLSAAGSPAELKHITQRRKRKQP
jgi:hypothetical protein